MKRSTAVWHRCVPICIALLIALSFVILDSGLSGSRPAAQTNLATFDLAGDTEFSNYRRVIADFAKHKRLVGRNDFCVVGYRAGDTKMAWVIWRQGRQIILWDGGATTLASSRRTIDLRRDVVKSGQDVGGSTYLTPRAWVDELNLVCKQRGKNVRIEKTGRP